MNKKRKYPLLGLLLGVAIAGSGCSSTTDNGAAGSTSPAASPAASPASSATAKPAAERVMKDALGYEVKIPANPQRIIASYLEDHLVALGVKPIAQWSVSNGKSVQSYLQKELNGIPTIPSDLPFEAVMSFAPDLILVDSAEQVAGDKYAQYAKIAPTFTVGSGVNNDWRQELMTVAEVLNKSAEAKKVLEGYDLKVKEAKEKLKQVIGTKSVAVLWVTTKDVYVPNEKLSSGDVLYRDLGLTVPEEIKEISKTAIANWNPIALEKLAQMNIDYLFIVNSKGGTKEEILKDSVWAGIPAVKNGQVFEYDNTASWLYTGAIANRQMIDNVLESILKKK
ncbi:MAG: putative transporter substrate binding protein [Paenibacillus sp.]|jgi:iron complex transport system substrate-binding protein|nr:putative transporter substrate binding protein [Paenibacillus sp.]